MKLWLPDKWHSLFKYHVKEILNQNILQAPCEAISSSTEWRLSICSQIEGSSSSKKN